MNMKDLFGKVNESFTPDKEQIRSQVLKDMLDEEGVSAGANGADANSGASSYVAKPKSTFGFWFQGNKRWVSVAAMVAFVVVALFASSFFHKVNTYANDFKDGFSMTPLQSDKYGVMPESGFMLKSKNPVTLDEIKSALTVMDGTKLIIAQKPDESGSNVFSVTPDGPLASDKIYKFKIARSDKPDVTWGFQTTTKMQVVGSLPAPEATSIALNSGIEIYFSRIGNYVDPQDYFSISPNIDGNLKIEQGRIVFVPKTPFAEGTIYTVKLAKGFGIKDSENVITKDFQLSFETQLGGEKIQDSLNFSTRFMYFYENVKDKFNINLSTVEKVTNPPAQSAPGSVGGTSSGTFGASLDTPPVVKVLPKINYSVYKYSDAASFEKDFFANNAFPSWSQKASTEINSIDTSNMSKVLDFSNSYNSDRQVQIPNKLSAGFYLIRASYGDVIDTALIQVCPFSIQVANVGTSDLLWVFNATTDMPEASANIDTFKLGADNKWSSTGGSLTTGIDGVVKADSTDAILYKVTGSGGQILYYINEPSQIIPYYAYSSKMAGNSSYSYPSNNSNDWWNVLYFDKSIYKVTDTMQFWGFAQHRGDFVSPAKLTTEVRRGWSDLYFGGYGYDMSRVYWYNSDDSSPALLSANVDANKGVFSGAFDLGTLMEGTYSLTIKSGDQVVSQKNFDIEKYTKPEFKFDATQSKTAMFWNQSATVDLSASFFDGTGVPNNPISYVANGGYDTYNLYSGTTKLDAQGKKTLIFDPNKNHYPVSKDVLSTTDQLTVSSKFPLVGEITKTLDFEVFHHDITGDFYYTVKNGVLTMKGETLKVDPNADPYAAPSKYKAAPNERVSGSFSYYWDVRVLQGYTYDDINKVNVPNYEYIQHEKVINTFDLKSDKDGKIDYSFALEKRPQKDASIDGIIDIHDSWGGMYENTIYEDYAYESGNPSIDYSNGPEFISSKDNVSIGDNLTFSMKNGKNKLPDSYSLYVVTNNGLIDYKVLKSSEFALTFEEKHSPGIEVDVYRFNGTSGFDAYSVNVAQEIKDNELKIKLTPDKTKYLPGEDATFSVLVTDKNGKPVQMAVNLSLVDEALLALREQPMDVLGDLYQIPYSGFGGFSSSIILSNGYSRDYYFNEAPTFGATDGFKNKNDISKAPIHGETVNGEAVKIRNNFLDVALFKLVTTDAQGKGKVTIQMPDNITGWRTFAGGVSESRLAGQTETKVTTSLDMFLQTTLSEQYLVGDVPKIGVSAFGNALKTNDMIDFNLEITDPSGKVENVSGNALAFEQTQLPLGKLVEGEYSVKVIGKSGALSDGVELKFRAVKSFVKHLQTDSYDAIPSLQLPPADGLVDLMLIDKQLSAAYEGLVGISYYGEGRLDGIVASMQSIDLLQSKFSANYYDSVDKSDMSSYQKSDGGLSVLPSGTSDITVSALAAEYLCKNTELGIDKASLINYFSTKLASGLAGDKGASLYGLISLGQPYLYMLDDMSNVDNLRIEDALWIALAYNYIGEKGKANALFQGRIESEIYVSNGNSLLKNMSGDQQITDLSLLAVIASEIMDPRAPQIYSYIMANPAKGTLTALQDFLYSQNEFSKLARTTTKVTYEVLGKAKTIQLNGINTESITITGDQLKTFRILEGSTNASLIVTRTESGIPTGVQKGGIVLSREFTALDSSVPITTLKLGDVVKVDIKVDMSNAPEGTYNVTVALPAGLKAIQNTASVADSSKNQSGWGWVQIDGQLLKFSAYRWFNNPVDTEVVYARCVSAGEYNVLPAFVQGVDTNDLYTLIDGMKVVVK